ncbi:GDSL-type esterase/lipase family protein [Cohnella sp. AR92]|uniref:GDSL-type esterase/lipase family protein n=1 Tax=Cohnella sp. AR92 TaxID=648716 RepID=UPI000F8C46B0|nr:GDSL-type esterase/lipase family protein [Cohnella sp. AR92]RUS46289.1 GDSL family lipase [Cohnella sp. AR92]
MIHPTKHSDSRTEPEINRQFPSPNRPASKLWPILGMTMAACFGLMLGGFGWALKDVWHPAQGLAIPEAATRAKEAGGNWEAKEEIKVVALGDSLTRGMGDETGEGYVLNAIAKLKEAFGKKARLVNNLAINGLTAARLNKQLANNGYASFLGQADLIFLTIGGNDLFRIARNGGSFEQGADVSPEQLRAKLPEAEELLREAFGKLRDLNPTARIVYIGLFNPFYDVPEARAFSDSIAEWNAYAHRLTAEDGNATIVPTYDLFESHIARYLSSDHFHPNEKGYARIADRIVQALQ